MSEGDERGRVLTDEERARALREQLKSLHAFDLAYEMMVSLVSFGYQKLGLTGETAELRDLDDAHYAIELLGRHPQRVGARARRRRTCATCTSTLAQMQLGYVQALELEGRRRSGRTEAGGGGGARAGAPRRRRRREVRRGRPRRQPRPLEDGGRRPREATAGGAADWPPRRPPRKPCSREAGRRRSPPGSRRRARSRRRRRTTRAEPVRGLPRAGPAGRRRRGVAAAAGRSRGALMRQMSSVERRAAVHEVRVTAAARVTVADLVHEGRRRGPRRSTSSPSPASAITVPRGIDDAADAQVVAALPRTRRVGGRQVAAVLEGAGDGGGAPDVLARRAEGGRREQQARAAQGQHARDLGEAELVADEHAGLPAGQRAGPEPRSGREPLLLRLEEVRLADDHGLLPGRSTATAFRSASPRSAR